MKKIKFLSIIVTIILVLNILLPVYSLAIDKNENKIQTEATEEENEGEKLKEPEQDCEEVEDLEVDKEDDEDLNTETDNNENEELEIDNEVEKKEDIENAINEEKIEKDELNSNELQEKNQEIKTEAQTIQNEVLLTSVDTTSLVKYSSYVQENGWEEDFSKIDGELSGTEGQGKRLEAIKINLNTDNVNLKNGSIKYQAHVQDYGWMDWKQNGEIAGVEGQGKRLEAIKIQLENLEGYSVLYRVHVQDYGWMDWKQNGEIAGTVGKGKRIEAIEIKITQQFKIKLENVYNQQDNTVTVIIHSNKQLANTKPTWNLSEDALSYSKTYNSNNEYKTTVQDIDGNILDVNIKITEIDDEGPKIKVEYVHNAEDNTVEVIIHSDSELADTKPTWNLSEDKLRYSKIFKHNSEYSTPVTDIYGNETIVQIKITQIIEVRYKVNEKDNTVTVTIYSNNGLQDTKPTWNYGSDKKSYTKTFDGNIDYTTPVVDATGKTVVLHIQVTQIIEVKYEYNSENNTVTVLFCSDREFQATKPSWTLSNDRKIYWKIFSENMNYTTPVVDINGITITLQIDITQIDDRAPEITQEHVRNEDGTVTVILHSNEELGDTKPSWKLSENRLSYSKTFNENIDYSTSLQDKYGNVVIVQIKVLISNFESLDESKYPGYKSLLRQIQANHEDWIITIKYTGLDWNTVIEKEYGFDGTSPRSLTQAPYLNEWKSAEDDNLYDVSQTWYRASKKAIAYMMDPRNSLEDAWIFQFQDLGSSAGTRKNIEKMVEGTYLNKDSIIDAILATAQEQSISPFHLVSRMLQEQYRDGSGIMNGYEYNGRKVYNLFNIKVSGNSSAGITAGAQYAYERHWFTPETCIMGSAEFLKKNYISKGQSTLYFQKYNVVYKDALYSHQYMQNIRAANDEGNTIYKSYKENGILDSQFEFIIPVYENMPTSASPRPVS